MGKQGNTGGKGNFQFLKEHDAVFRQLVSTAEQLFSAAPNTTLIHRILASTKPRPHHQ